MAIILKFSLNKGTTYNKRALLSIKLIQTVQYNIKHHIYE